MLALDLAMNARPVWFDLTAMALLFAGQREQPRLKIGVGHLSGNGQHKPANWKRVIVVRTVEAANRRRAISRLGTSPRTSNAGLRALSACNPLCRHDPPLESQERT